MDPEPSSRAIRLKFFDQRALDKVRVMFSTGNFGHVREIDPETATDPCVDLQVPPVSIRQLLSVKSIVDLRFRFTEYLAHDSRCHWGNSEFRGPT